MQNPSYNRSLHWVAIATAIATFPLIFMGGRVTTMGAGMSVPDWPNSYGYNMFLFPPNQWVGGILYEHTHRLMATVVGFLSITLALVAWGPARIESRRKKLLIATTLIGGAALVLGLILLTIKASHAPHVAEVFSRTSHMFVLSASVALVLGVASLSRRQEPRRWLRWTTVCILVAVCLQGLLGGLRVTQVNLTLAIIHGCFAQAFFCFVGFAILATSRLWDLLAGRRPVDEEGRGTALPETLRDDIEAARSLARLAVLGVTVIFLQLIVGAVMRHYDAGLAIPDLPLHYGKVLPPTDDVALAEANLMRANSGSPDLRPVTLTQIWLHTGHRAGALLVTGVLSLLIWRSLRRPGHHLAARLPALFLIPLLLLQLTLGVLTVLFHKPADVASLHVAIGALVLLTTFMLASRALLAVRGSVASHSVARTPPAGIEPLPGLQRQPAVRA